VGYREDESKKALQDVPLFIPDPASWPKGVRVIGSDELDNLGIDRGGVLYWNGRVITIEKRLTLTLGQKFWAVIVGVSAILVSLSTIIQGVASYSSWACTVGWPAICP
jgi:hypothetical protein